MKEKENITNGNYQTPNDISKATTTGDLTELVEKFKVFKKADDIEAGMGSILMGSIGS